MKDNTRLLSDLMRSKRIRLHDAEVLHQPPRSLPETFSFEKVEGMMLSVAIGDALGATTEGLEPAIRSRRFGEIRDYVPGRRSDSKSVGVATDDTQLSFWTLEQLMDDGGLDPDHLAQKFCRHRISGMGSTTREFVRNYRDKHLPWYEAGVDSLGNGSLMRIAPVILPYLRHPHPSLYADAALDTMTTHNSFANNATCVAFVKMLWDLLGMTSAPGPEWWIDTYCSMTRRLEGNTRYRPRHGEHTSYEGPLWKYADNVFKEALHKGLSVKDACEWWGSGTNLFETVPSVLYILATHGHDPEEAIVRAVNDTKDNDTVGAIVGAAVGALHGKAFLPERWMRNLSGNVRIGGSRYQVFRLITLAEQVFWLKCNSH